MWLFCKSGFFSAVLDFDNPDRVLVRARFNGDLERLLKNMPSHAKVEILHTPDADYPYRMFVKKSDWEMAVLTEAEDMDYTNFKNAVHDGTARDAAYMRVWTEMRLAQPRRP